MPAQAGIPRREFDSTGSPHSRGSRESAQREVRSLDTDQSLQSLLPGLPGGSTATKPIEDLSQRRLPMARRFLITAIALLFPMLRGSITPAQSIQKVATIEGISEYRLDNGLRILLLPDPSRPKVTVNLTVLVGSRHEGYGETGMAHLLEHMVFKGTPTHPDIPGAMKERGAQFNGSTWLDRTNYYETLPASDENLEFAIRLEADRMVNSPIRAEDLATEFSVVRNEFESGENSPSRVLMQRMTAVAYEWHNYGKSTIGNRSDIERVPVDNLRAFYRKYYQPDNAILVVAGQFNEQKALDLIAKYFGAIPRPDRKLDATYTEEPPQDGERAVTLRRVGDVGIVGLMYHVPASAHPDSVAVSVLASILGDEPSGRLYKALVETGKATDVSAGTFPTRDPGLIQAQAEVNSKDPQVLESVRDIMIDVLENLARNGVTQEEVDRARQKLLRQRALAAADPNQIAIQLSEWAAQGDWRLYFIARDRLEKVSPEQVNTVAANYLRPSNRTVGLFIPTEQSDRTPIPQTPDIAALVAGYQGRDASSAGEALDVTPASIQARVLYPEPIEGVQVALLPKKTSGEAVHVVVNLRFGDEQTLKGLVQAADFLPGLMMRGTKNLSRQQIQDALDKNFASMGRGGGGGTMGGGGGGSLGLVSFSFQTKRANLPAVLDILRQILREPTLPEAEFETLKRNRLAQLESTKSDPMALGSNRLQRSLSSYDPDDVRYTPTIDEQIERIKATTIDQVRTLYTEYLGAGHGEVAIVGDFDTSEAITALKPLFEGWSAKKPYRRIARPFQVVATPGRQTIDTPDKANAAYFAGISIPMNDTNPDYPALLAGNSILGGGSLSSRIADRLRQKGGLSYSAASILNANPIDERTNLVIFAIYNPVNVAKVVEGVQDELDKLLTEGVKPDELETAKKGYLQQQVVRRTSDSSLASTLANNLFLKRTLAFDDALEASVSALTTHDVNAALRKYIDPAQMAVITAGDFASKPQINNSGQNE